MATWRLVSWTPQSWIKLMLTFFVICFPYYVLSLIHVLIIFVPVTIGKHNELEKKCMSQQQCFIKQKWDEQLFWANLLAK